MKEDDMIGNKIVSRRKFIQQSTTGLAGLSILSRCSTPSKRKLDEIGLQLSTIRKPLEDDWKKAFQRVAEIGYKTIEGGGPRGGLSVEEFKTFLKEIGLNPLSTGTSMQDIVENLDQSLEQAINMGQKWFICFWPWTGSSEDKKLDDWKEVAERLNKAGEKVKAAGLGFAYHNHDIEFALTEEQIPFDILLDETDANLVDIEIDLYWIAKGGQDPIPYFKKYPGRFPLWHIKDMDDTEEQSFACVGSGILDFSNIFKHADIAGMKHVFVEHDRPEDPMACIQSSYDYLNGLRY
ncbi:sugar phosphate isomerase/epimerase [candidate division KSB1 bacterium]|nr:sugar phosphate isomerase/epimerase [candidate division KSB1 bacterium]